MKNLTPDLIYAGTAGIPLPPETKSARAPIKTSYVDIEELQEALDLYYDGQLDYVNPIYAMNDLNDLVPGKTLISVLEESDIELALNRLPFNAACYIEAFHSIEDIKTIDSFIEYFKALELLAEEVLHII